MSLDDDVKALMESGVSDIKRKHPNLADNIIETVKSIISVRLHEENEYSFDHHHLLFLNDKFNCLFDKYSQPDMLQKVMDIIKKGDAFFLLHDRTPCWQLGSLCELLINLNPEKIPDFVFYDIINKSVEYDMPSCSFIEIFKKHEEYLYRQDPKNILPLTALFYILDESDKSYIDKIKLMNDDEKTNLCLAFLNERKIYRELEDKNMMQPWFCNYSIHNNLTFDDKVYKEFSEEIRKSSSIIRFFDFARSRMEKIINKEEIDPINENEHIKKITSVVEKERDFLNQQTPGSVFPIAMMLYHTGQEYASKIRDLKPYVLDNLSQAWAIAKNNPDEIKMEEFYGNLKGALDRGYADRWAKAIVDGYRKRKDEGLKMVLKDVA